MIRLLAAVALLASLGGCGVPAAVVWGAVGAGLGYGASINNLGAELVKRRPTEPDHPSIEELPTPP